jgi:hypothetical protein
LLRNLEKYAAKVLQEPQSHGGGESGGGGGGFMKKAAHNMSKWTDEAKDVDDFHSFGLQKVPKIFS